MYVGIENSNDFYSEHHLSAILAVFALDHESTQQERLVPDAVIPIYAGINRAGTSDPIIWWIPVISPTPEPAEALKAHFHPAQFSTDLLEEIKDTFFERTVEDIIIFTKSRGLTGAGLVKKPKNEPCWEDVKDMQQNTVQQTIIDDTLPRGRRTHHHLRLCLHPLRPRRRLPHRMDRIRKKRPDVIPILEPVDQSIQYFGRSS